VFLAALSPVPALAAQAGPHKTVPCWEALLNESYTGSISTIYPKHCYTEALKHVPAIAQIYGNEKQQIRHAMQLAALGKLPPGSSGASTTTPSSGGSSGGISGFIKRLNPGSANAFPTPLLILGALAILLVIAGVAGMLWQRSHPRETGTPTTAPELPPGRGPVE
jgi:hypothetical protein